MNDTIKDVYERTMNNCKFYEKEGDKASLSLLHEIGVLRGVAYCMEIIGMPFVNDDFMRFINKQQDLKEQLYGKI